MLLAIFLDIDISTSRSLLPEGKIIAKVFLSEMIKFKNFE
ncbi:hypothetical protein YN1HA_10120 [Sulfurisphaera ohwakuensis]